MRKNFRATDIGKCPTRLYFEFTKPKTHGQVPEKLQEIWDVGTKLHNEMISEYKKAGLLRKKNLYVYYELHRIAGEADCTVNYDEIETVVEFKSINHKDFLGLVGPLLDHRLQLMFYLDRLTKRPGILIYIDKKKMEVPGGIKKHKKKVFKVDYDKEEIEKQYKWLDNLWVNNIKTKTVPDRRFTLCRECLRCYYKENCKTITTNKET